ncbi:MAG: hypothetical protein NT062_09165 [Proteobacteria bacterium]|nr:hypothetical protein [Pseudomonadota bacterium]
MPLVFLALVVLVVALLAFKVELTLVATIAIGVVCLAWLIAIVVLPWNLYFRARRLLVEMSGSERRGIAIAAEARAVTHRIAARMLAISLALHVFSAALLCAGAWLLGERMGYAFGGLFLLTTLFRPAVEYYRYLHGKLTELRHDVLYPRDDVMTLVDDVRRTGSLADQHERQLGELGRELGDLREALRDGDRENARKLDAVARKFEETIDRMTDNQEIISGIKAFLRLVQPAR